MEKAHLNKLRKGSVVIINGNREQVLEVYETGIKTVSKKRFDEKVVEPSFLSKKILRGYGFTERVYYKVSIMTMCIYEEDDESCGLFLEAFYSDEEDENVWRVGITTAPEESFCCTEHEFQNLFLSVTGYDADYNKESGMFGWIVYDFSDEKREVHSIPLNDTKRHIQNLKCRCNPDSDMVMGLNIIVHNSFDGREAVELANSILDGYDI